MYDDVSSARKAAEREMSPDVLTFFRAVANNDCDTVSAFLTSRTTVRGNKKYDCPVCNDTGTIIHKTERGEWAEFCQCEFKKRAVARLADCGLVEQIKAFRFDNFDIEEDWQRGMYTAVKKYAEKPVGWLLVCGQNGSGKTHLCTAAFGKLIAVMGARYMPWVEVSRKIKMAAFDEVDYYRALDPYTHAEMLYIDDLFKTNRRGRGGDIFSGITDADIKLAFEILDYRARCGLKTMISSEWTIDELYDIDAGVGGRILKECGADGHVCVARDKRRDHRLKGLNIV